MREYPIFSNIKQHILSLLRESKRSIIIAVAWFTDIDIIRLLEEKSQEGVSISILISLSQLVPLVQLLFTLEFPPSET